MHFFLYMITHRLVNTINAIIMPMIVMMVLTLHCPFSVSGPKVGEVCAYSSVVQGGSPGVEFGVFHTVPTSDDDRSGKASIKQLQERKKHYIYATV